MKIEEITSQAGLETKHYKIKTLDAPIIDSMLYTSLGKQLYDLYEKYKVDKQDQRQLESLCFLLTSFTLERELKPSLLKRLFGSKG